MAARPRRTARCRALRLSCWNADGVRGRKPELENFLSQHGVDICFLSETFLNRGQDFRLANDVCHCTDTPTARGGTAILVRRGIVHNSVPVPGLTHLEATALQLTLAVRPVKILAAHLSSYLPLIVADLTTCFGGIAGHYGRRTQRQTHGLELEPDHETGKFLRDYADENSCLIVGPDTPTTNRYNSSATHDILDIAVAKDLPFPLYPTSCSALNSDDLPVLIDTACRSSFQHPPDRPDFRRTNWDNFQTHLEDQIPFDPELHNGMAIDTCLENFSGAVLRVLAASPPKCRPRYHPRPLIQAA